MNLGNTGVRSLRPDDAVLRHSSSGMIYDALCNEQIAPIYKIHAYFELLKFVQNRFVYIGTLN
jgi:hypothetical protein